LTADESSAQTQDACFQGFDFGDASQPVAIAVSGGSDSLALLHAAVDWAHGEGRTLVALTVDHGLRAGSRAEAGQVGALAAQLGVPHRILTLSENRAVQAYARMGRHRLLAEAVRGSGGRWLLTGHTLDDQFETMLMRARQGSSWYGLGAMDPVSVSPAWPEGRGVMIARPFLATRRSVLQARLIARRSTWIDDPSNADDRFERVRMRRLLQRSDPLRRRVHRVHTALASLRQAERRRLGHLLTTTVEPLGQGQLAWTPGPLPCGTAQRLLSWLVQIAAGHDRPPTGDGLRAIVSGLVPQKPFPARTLAGAWLLWTGTTLHLSRDPGLAASAPNPRHALWDGRFERHLNDGLYPSAAAIQRPLRPVLPPEPPAWRDLTVTRLQDLAWSLKS